MPRSRKTADVVGEVLGSAGAVGADQDRNPVPVSVGNLRECGVERFDVVGSGVGAGVARPQHTGQGLVGVVQPHQDGVEPIAALVLCTRQIGQIGLVPVVIGVPCGR
jgi:hypothetical protein